MRPLSRFFHKQKRRGDASPFSQSPRQPHGRSDAGGGVNDDVEKSPTGNAMLRKRLHAFLSSFPTHSLSGTEYSVALMRY